MDLNELEKQLGELNLNSNSNFTAYNNPLGITEEHAQYIMNLPYYGKEVEAVLINNPESEDSLYMLYTSRIISVKSDSKGIYFNGKLYARWKDKRAFKGVLGIVVGDASITLMPKSILLNKPGEVEVERIISFENVEKMKPSIEEGHQTYMNSFFKDGNDFFGKNVTATIKHHVRKELKETKRITQFRVDEEGIWVNGKCKIDWSLYYPMYCSIRGDITGLSIVPKKSYVYAAIDDYNFTKVVIAVEGRVIGLDDEVYLCRDDWDAELWSEMPYELLSESKADISAMKPVEGEENRYIQDIEPVKFDLSSLFSDYCNWLNVGFTLVTGEINNLFHDAIFLDMLSIYRKPEEPNVQGDGFEIKSEGNFLVFDGTKEELELATTFKVQGGSPVYRFGLSKLQFRRIQRCGKFEIILQTNTKVWTLKGDDVKAKAIQLDQMLYHTPQHEMEYYDARISFNDEDYEKALLHINKAIVLYPDESMYFVFRDDLRKILADKDAKMLEDAKKLFEAKNYQDAIELLKTLLQHEEKPEYKDLLEKASKERVIQLQQECRDLLAAEKYEEANQKASELVSLAPTSDNQELKNKIVHLLAQDKFSQAKSEYVEGNLSAAKSLLAEVENLEQGFDGVEELMQNIEEDQEAQYGRIREKFYWFLGILLVAGLIYWMWTYYNSGSSMVEDPVEEEMIEQEFMEPESQNEIRQTYEDVDTIFPDVIEEDTIVYMGDY